MTTAPMAVPLWNSALPSDRPRAHMARVVRSPHGQFADSNRPRAIRQESSHANPVA